MKTISLEQEPTPIIRPALQIALICLSLCIISYAVYRKTAQLDIYDPKRNIIQVTPEIYKKLGTTPEIIQVGLHINQFKKFNIVTNEFDFTGVIWFAFNQYAIDLETLGKFVFEEGTIEYRSSPEIQFRDGKFLVRYNIRASVSSPFNYLYFPLNNHRLNIIVTNYFVSPSTIIFQATSANFLVDENPTEYGWQVFNRSVSAGFEKSELDPYDPSKTAFYPLAVFSTDYTRYGIRYLLSIMLPLLLLFYLSLFSFSRPDTGELDLSVGGITGTLGYRFVIENFSPNPGYFILADYIFFLFLGAAAAIFIFNIFDSYITKHKAYARLIGLVSIHTVVATLCVYLFLS